MAQLVQESITDQDGEGRARRWRGPAAVVFAAALAFGGVACSSDSDASSDGDGGGGDTASEEAASETTMPAGPCPTATSLTIVDSDVADGPVDVVTEFADIGGLGSADLVFTSYDFEEDSQFGLSAPVGEPDVPDGETLVQFSLDGDGDELAVGTYPASDTSPRVSFESIYYGSERIVPMSDHEIELTEVTDEQVCGTITPVVDPDSIQELPQVFGDFVVPVA